MVENANYITDVKVLDVEKRYRPGPKHYVCWFEVNRSSFVFSFVNHVQVYIIQVTWSNPVNTFIIYRRYAQFFDLQCQLLDLFAEAPSPSNRRKRVIPFLPGKIFLGRSQIRQVALERRHALNIYCRVQIVFVLFYFIELICIFRLWYLYPNEFLGLVLFWHFFNHYQPMWKIPPIV